MSEDLNTELINLYNFYREQENPPDLMEDIKSFLINVEGINPDTIEATEGG